MKIPSNNPGIYSAEQSYRNFDHKVRQDEPLKPSQSAADAIKKETIAASGQEHQPSTKAVFSNQELAALKAFFGYDNQENFNLYGRNKIRNVQSGMLLDVKG